MRRISVLSLLIAVLTFAAQLRAQIPYGDFPYTDRDGRATTLYGELAALQPECRVWLLLFDPDCDECHGLMADMMADGELNAGLADGSCAVFAIFPSDMPLEADDPNMLKYNEVKTRLPETWRVGTDNGSILETDSYEWTNLPQLYRFTMPQIKE